MGGMMLVWGFCLSFLLALLLGTDAAWAICPPVSATVGGVSGSPFTPANRDVTSFSTQTSDNVRVTGGCIDVETLNVRGNGPNNACNPVTDQGADPTGVSDAATAINSCAAVTKNGNAVNVYLPAGTYRANDQINLAAGQCLYGDGRGTTTITVDQSFSVSALGIVVLTGGERAAPCIHDLAISFAQPSDQATRANFANLGTCTSGAGGTGCKYPPAVYSGATGANRIKLYRLYIERAWDGINIQKAGGCTFRDVEVSALNVGLQLDGGADVCYVDTYHFWPFGIDTSTALYTGVYLDGSTYAAQIGRVDGLSAKSFTAVNGRVALTSNFTWGTFTDLKLDGNNSTLEIARTTNPGLQINGVYSSSGTPVGGAGSFCEIDVGASNTTTIITNYSAANGAVASLCAKGGVVIVDGAEFRGNNANTGAIVATGGNLQVTGSKFTTGVSWNVPLVSATSTHLSFTGNHFQTTGTGTALSVATDYSDNYVAGNNFNAYTASRGFSTLLGYYDLGDQAQALTITPAFATPGDFAPANATTVGAYFLRGNYVDFYLNESFDTNAYTTAGGNFRLGHNMPPAAGGAGGHQPCLVGEISKVNITYIPGCSLPNGTQYTELQKVNTGADSTKITVTEVPASRAGYLFRVTGRYRAR